MGKTTEYFNNVSVEFLQNKDANGYTTEESWIIANTIIDHPFFNTLEDANKTVEWVKAHSYLSWTMLEMTDGRIALLI